MQHDLCFSLFFDLRHELRDPLRDGLASPRSYQRRLRLHVPRFCHLVITPRPILGTREAGPASSIHLPMRSGPVVYCVSRNPVKPVSYQGASVHPRAGVALTLWSL